jgi:outer membrane translocation and assembly module TamA
VTVQSIRLRVDEHDLPHGHSPYDRLALKKGDVFTEDAYQRSEETLRNFYRDAGYAHIEITRAARVNITANQARVWYSVHRGVRAAFGNTKVVGEKDVDPRIILRETNGFHKANLTNQETRFSSSACSRSFASILS